VLTCTGNGSAVSWLCSARPCRPTDGAVRLVLLSALSKHGTVSTVHYCQIAVSWHRPFCARRRCASIWGGRIVAGPKIFVTS
jgi:hypothetical protein